MKTKNWIITLSVSLIFVTFMLIWILIGQNNALGYRWIIAHNGLMWSGEINSNNYNDLKTLFPWIDVDPSNFGFYHIYNVNNIIINLNLIWILLGVFGFFTISSLVLKIFKLVNWDFVSFTLTTNITGFLFFFINLIPHWKNDNLVYTITVLLITVLLCATIFFILNSFFNALIAKSRTAFEYSKGIESEDKEIANSDNEVSNMIKNVKEEKDYIEI